MIYHLQWANIQVHETCQLRYDVIVTNIKIASADNDISCVIVTNIILTEYCLCKGVDIPIKIKH